MVLSSVRLMRLVKVTTVRVLADKSSTVADYWLLVNKLVLEHVEVRSKAYGKTHIFYESIQYIYASLSPSTGVKRT